VNSYKKNLKQKYPDCWQWISLAGRIPGQLSEREAYLLFQLARARTPSVDPVIVELGARRGRTSLLLAAGLCGKTGPRLFSFQSMTADGHAASTLDWKAFHRILQRCRLRHIVEATPVVEATPAHSRGVPGNWKDEIDILLIDATEDCNVLRGDLLLWLRFVRLGGIVVLHGSTAQFPALQPPQYGDLRQVDSLTWAVKECADASVNLPGATGLAGLDTSLGEPVPSSQELQRLQCLLNRSTEAMLHLNAVPAGVESGASNQIDHLEHTAQMARARLQDYLRRGAKELAENRHAIQALRRSWSWRLTRPLRLGIETGQAITGFLGSLHNGRAKARIAGLTDWMRFGSEVRASNLFDERYYQEHHRDVGWARTNPMLHFFVCGASEGGNPNELFDIEYYLGRYPEVARSGVNPLLHYLRGGAYEGRDPHPHFDSSFYLEQNPDVREGRLNPLAHYLAPGIAEGRDPNPWFDTSEYLEQNPDVAIFGLNPLAHQLEVWTTHHACSQW